MKTQIQFQKIRFQKPLEIHVPFPNIHDIEIKEDGQWFTIIFKFKSKELDYVDTLYLKAKLLAHNIMRLGEYSVSVLFDKDLEYDLQIMFLMPKCLN